MIRILVYSGSKARYIGPINRYINSSKSNVYIEPFIGSGSVLVNLEKEFDQYIINDLCSNMVSVFRSIQKCTYKDYTEVVKKFKSYGAMSKDKQRYYDFRQYYNDHHFGKNTIDGGLYLIFLANNCINGWVSFGPNGMNSPSGCRRGGSIFTKQVYETIKSRIERCEIHNTTYQELLSKHKEGFVFLDPPYYSAASSYAGFSLVQHKEFISIVETLDEYVYTDILNEYNKHLNHVVLREMVSTAASSNKQKNGNMECIFTNLKKQEGFINRFF